MYLQQDPRTRGRVSVQLLTLQLKGAMAARTKSSIAFGLTGPSFSVGGGMHAALEALASAAVLVESGDADRMVVVSVDDVGPATLALGERSLRAGAVAVLVSARPDAGARARIGAIELRRGELRAGTHAAGHLALRPLLESRLPAELVGSSPPDGFARVALHPL